MNHRLHLTAFLSAALLGFAMSCGTANAELVGTDEATASLESADREKLRAFMERPDVVEKLKALGVSADDAKARVGALSDAEIHMIAGKLEMLPAGGRITNNDLVLIIAVILAIVLLIIVL